MLCHLLSKQILVLFPVFEKLPKSASEYPLQEKQKKKRSNKMLSKGGKLTFMRLYVFG